MRLRLTLCFMLVGVLFQISARIVFAEVSLEEVVQAGRFVFYRDAGNPHKYYYAPDQPRLALGEDGKPQFTFIKYTRAGAEGTNPQARGGLVHFLVTWGFDESARSSAESALKGQDPDAQLVGPIPFKEGTFAIVSASAGEGGIFTRKIVGTGKAPVLPGMKAAVSIALTPEGATLLWESFQKATSDVSVVFLLKFSGLTPAFQAKLKVNWEKVYTHHDIAAGISAQYAIFKAAADIRAIFDDFRKNGTIQLEVTGENQNMQKLLDMAYEHILRQMFDPVMLPPDAASTPQADIGGTGGGARPPRAPSPYDAALRYDAAHVTPQPRKSFALYQESGWRPIRTMVFQPQGETGPQTTSSSIEISIADFLAPIPEPYTPRGTDHQRNVLANQVMDAADADYAAGRHRDALDKYLIVYA
ncbi:MAG: hypothetical protein ACREJQ_00130, partial [bacterium]